MALHQSHLAGRATSLPLLAADLPRRSFESTAPSTARSRRGSVDLRASRGDNNVLAASLLAPHVRDGVLLEVGRSLDVNEQRRRLERHWNTEDPSTPSTSDDQDGYESDSSGEPGSSTPSADPRLHLQQRWRAQSSQSDASVTVNRKAVGRRRQYGTVGKGRRSRTPTRHRARAVGRVRALPTATQSRNPTCSEVADEQFLTRMLLGLHRQRSTASSAVAPTLGSVFNGWGNTGVLKKDTEMELGRIVQKARATQEKLEEKESSLGRKLTPEEMEAEAGVSLEQIQLRMRNKHTAQQLLVQYNIRLLAKVARQFEGRGVELEDLIVEGTQGLERAIERYDPSKGYKFSTYAYMWIRQAIGRSIMENARVVRLPGHVYEMVGRIQKTRELLASTSETGTASDEAVAATLGLPVEKVTAYTQAGRTPHSLDDVLQPGSRARPTEDAEQTLGDILPDEGPSALEQVEEDFTDSAMREDVDTVLSGLTLRERNVLRYRYGLHTEAMSLGELSAAYGLSRERIRQISEVALAKLQLRQASEQNPVDGRGRNLPRLRPELYGRHFRL